MTAPFPQVCEPSDFRRGGKYYGALTAVSRECNASLSHVSMCLHGTRTAPRVVAALRTEMARRDAEPATKQGVFL